MPKTYVASYLEVLLLCGLRLVAYSRIHDDPNPGRSIQRVVVAGAIHALYEVASRLWMQIRTMLLPHCAEISLGADGPSMCPYHFLDENLEQLLMGYRGNGSHVRRKDDTHTRGHTVSYHCRDRSSKKCTNTSYQLETLNKRYM